MKDKKVFVILILGIALALISRFDSGFLFGGDTGRNSLGQVEGVSQESGENNLKVVVFDVGQGDSIFIETPGKKQFLIDGGPSSVVLEKLNKYMDFGDNFIDVIVLTHPHADHVSGLVEVLKRYKVGEIWMTGVVHTSAIYLEFLNLIKENNIKARVIYSCGNSEAGIIPPSTTQNNLSAEKRGPLKGKNYELGEEYSGCVDVINVDDGISFRVLYPFENLSGQTIDNLNNSSIVLKLIDGRHSMLFTGDAEEPVEKELLATFDATVLHAEVLKVGHHGSITSSTENFLTAVAPNTAVISVGANNDYGQPSLRVIRRMERLGIEVKRTDEDGDVEFNGDEEKIFQPTTHLE